MYNVYTNTYTLVHVILESIPLEPEHSEKKCLSFFYKLKTNNDFIWSTCEHAGDKNVMCINESSAGMS